ncbi:hypothetical protein [Dyella sp. ASV21]|nr:hypothetical protein [Dyella sp. ASV21]
MCIRDRGLPGKDGLDVLTEARHNHIRTPVLAGFMIHSHTLGKGGGVIHI